MKTPSLLFPFFNPRRTRFAHTLANIGLTLGLLGAASTACAATNYFINNKADSNCSDTATDAGTQAKPWCSFAPIASVAVNAGDIIHLANGATWSNQTLRFNSVRNGSEGQPITIQAYGSGLQRPHITSSDHSFEGQRNFRGIVLNDASYWVIKDLEISHAGAGILFRYTSKNKQYIRLSNLYLHHNYGYERVKAPNQVDDIGFSAGIVFTGSNIALEPADVVVRDVIIEDIVGTRNQDSIAIDFPPSVHATAGAGQVKVPAVKDLLLNRLHLFQDDADGKSTGCSDSLRLVKVYNLTLMNSLIENAGGCVTNSGTVAVFMGYTDGAKLINNIIRDTQVLSGTPDQGGIDLEIDNSNVSFFGNLISGNQYGIECMMFRTEDFLCEPHILNNGFINNRRGVMFINGDNQPQATGEMKHNLYYSVPGSYLKWNDSNNALDVEFYDVNNAVFASMATTENNVETNMALPNPEDFYSAAGDFSNSQAGRWGYQYFDAVGSKWENLTNYETTAIRSRWGNSSQTAFVSPFEMKPTAHTGVSNSGAVARIWRAPKDGNVVIRGQIAKSELDPTGNGILALIEKVDVQSTAVTKLWPLATAKQNIGKSDILGVRTQVESTAVKAGDILRFIVSSNGDAGLKDTVTWAPMVAYVAGPKSKSWTFNTPNWLEYWGPSYAGIEAPSVGADGSLRLKTTQANPHIFSRKFKNIATDSYLLGSEGKFFSMRIKHNLSGVAQTQMALRWTRESNNPTDKIFNDDKMILITLSNSNEYQDIGPLNLNELNSTYWTDDSQIIQLRLDPIENTAHEAQLPEVNIDYIRLDSAASNPH